MRSICMHSDMASQARELIDRMKNDPKVDFVNDWKVVTILSGNNDLCDSCNKPVRGYTNTRWEFGDEVASIASMLDAQRISVS